MPDRHAWIKRICKGDVLRFPGDVLRVVREVKHWPNNNDHSKTSTSVTLAIRRCSWTHRPFTCYSDNDLKQLGVRPTRAKVLLRKKIDKALEYEITGRKITRWDGSTYGSPVMPWDSKMDCCDARGLA